MISSIYLIFRRKKFATMLVAGLQCGTLNDILFTGLTRIKLKKLLRASLFWKEFNNGK